MNRREAIAAGAAAAAAPVLAQAAQAQPLIVHAIRLGFAPGITPALRAQHVLTINRFKQIKSTTLMVAGRDVSAAGGFDYGQISVFASEAAFRDYFYDPIHLAADKEGDTFHAINRGRSFDVLPRYSDALAARLKAVTTGREARFKAKDDRPTSPPTADRPQDQRWNFGRAFFQVARFSFAPGAPGVAAFARLQAASPGVLAGGREATAPAPGREGHALIQRFPDEAVYRAWRGGAAYAQAKAAGLFDAGASDIYFVIDPADEALAARLKAG